MRYFRKRNVTGVPVYGPGGQKIPFAPLAHVGDGVLATEDAGLVASLEDLIRRRSGGVRELTLADYEDLKKNQVSSPVLRQPHSPLLRPQPLPRELPGPPQDQLAAAVAEIPGSRIFREEAARLLRARPPRVAPLKSASHV